MSNSIVGLDIGTCYIRTVIAELNENDELEIIGVAKRPSRGLRNGVIVNIDAAVAAIKETIEAAEQSAGVEVTAVYTDIGGTQAESLNSKGQIGVDTTGKNRQLEISLDAKNRAIEAAKAVVIPLDKKLIHIIPQEYIIDGAEGYKNPLGIMGVRLEVKVHLVTASITAYSNIAECVNRAGYSLRDNKIMLKTLAASYAAVHEDEMDLGSILIDLGCGTTDVMVLNKGAPVYTASIPCGGQDVTSDIHIVKGIPLADAEKIKIESGCCYIPEDEQDEEVIIPGVGGRPPEVSTKYELCQIIQPRVAEIMTMVKQNVVKNSGLKTLNGSIVLTGGGALMSGIVELTQMVWKTSSVRIGVASDFGGVDNTYRDADFATAVGLVLANKDTTQREKSGKRAKDGESKDSFLEKTKAFINRFF